MTNRPKPVNSRHERSTSNAVTSASPLTVKLTRGTGTRDQDKIVAKRKARLWKTLARTWRFFEYIHDLAEDARQIQPKEEDG